MKQSLMVKNLLFFVLHCGLFAGAKDSEVHPHYRNRNAVLLYPRNDDAGADQFLELHHKQILDAPDTRYVAYRRGGVFGRIGTADAHLERLSSPDGAVAINPSRHHQYVGRIGVGTPPQYFNVILDTGSTNIWFIGDDCLTCTAVSGFKPHLSSTYQVPRQQKFVKIMFGTGVIEGKSAIDSIQVGPFVVKDTTFGLVSNERNRSSTVNSFDDFEGIVGMAFPEMSAFGSGGVVDKIIDGNMLDEPDFSFYLSRDEESVTEFGEASPVAVMFWGGVDERLFHPPLQFVQVKREHYWEVALQELWIGDRKFCCDDETKTLGKPSYVIFDSGTTFNTLPSKEMREFLELLPPRGNCNADDLKDPSYLRRFPSIKYVLDGGVEIVLSPEEYMTIGEKSGLCQPGYMAIEVPSEFGHAYLLGSYAFMRHYFTVYARGINGEASRVGLARSKHVSPKILRDTFGL